MTTTNKILLFILSVKAIQGLLKNYTTNQTTMKYCYLFYHLKVSKGNSQIKQINQQQQQQ